MKVYDGNIFESIFVNVTLTDAFFLANKGISRQFLSAYCTGKKIAHCMQLNDTLKVVVAGKVTKYQSQIISINEVEVLAFYTQQARIFFSQRPDESVQRRSNLLSGIRLLQYILGDLFSLQITISSCIYSKPYPTLSACKNEGW